MDEMNNMNPGTPGKGQAIASLVLGIVSVVLAFCGWLAIPGLVCGIVSLVCASMSKKAGFAGGIRTAGFVLGIIGVVLCAICTACVACAAGTAASLGLF